MILYRQLRNILDRSQFSITERKHKSLQKTAISVLHLYLMSSSILRMNKKTKKRPAPPRKCQMSCLISTVGKWILINNLHNAHPS